MRTEFEAACDAFGLDISAEVVKHTSALTEALSAVHASENLPPPDADDVATLIAGALCSSAVSALRVTMDSRLTGEDAKRFLHFRILKISAAVLGIHLPPPPVH